MLQLVLRHARSPLGRFQSVQSLVNCGLFQNLDVASDLRAAKSLFTEAILAVEGQIHLPVGRELLSRIAEPWLRYFGYVIL